MAERARSSEPGRTDCDRRLSPGARIRRAPDDRRRGLALLFVLWGVTLLALLAAGFLDRTRTEALMVANRAAAAEAVALADGGIHRAIRTLLAARQTGATAPPTDGTPRMRAVAGGRLTVAIRDEAGKLDLNGADPVRLERLLVALGESPSRARSLTARILDFADKDSLPRPEGGAEAADYAALGLAHGPADRRFLSVAELGQVAGIGPGLAARIAPHVTVGVFARGVDPRVASEPALLAQPGLDPAAVADWLARRRAGGPPPEGTVWTTSPRTRFTIRATARTARARFAREALVTLDPRSRPPWRIRAWRQVDAAAPGP